MKKTRGTTGRRQWTADEHADLWRLKCEGVQLSEIARRLGMDLSSCFGRLKKTDDSGQYMSTHRPGAMRWTPGMDARVLELREAGMTNNQVGEMIGLRGTQVASRVRELRAWSAADKPRFTVHVAGPDDVVPFHDELEAHRYANSVNAAFRLTDGLCLTTPPR